MSTALQVSNPKELLGFLTKSRSAIEMALPKHLNPDRMMRLALTCFSTNPALRECSAQSILASIVVASQIGLEPGVAGQGYLIPYKQTCTFVPGWQGLVGLLNNTGRATAWTGAVFDGDGWTYRLGSAPMCEHTPGPNYGDPDKLIWVYACGKVNGSEQPVIEAWPIERVKKHRDKFNKVGARHYSYANFEMYARKVVLLQVLKYMPRSIELSNAIVAADAGEIGHTTRVEDGVIIDLPVDEPAIEKVTALPNSADRKLEADAGLAPVGVMKPGELTGSNAELAVTVTKAGFTFDDFKKWALDNMVAADFPADDTNSFADLKQPVSKRLMRATGGLLAALRKQKGGVE